MPQQAIVTTLRAGLEAKQRPIYDASKYPAAATLHCRPNATAILMRYCNSRYAAQKASWSPSAGS